MRHKFISTAELPFCKGCGHHIVVKNTLKALQLSGFNPLDVILVTDIGCHGIIDNWFNTHTVHGLHGRAVALGAGISMALSNPSKKVIVFIGDGGATIGLKHLIRAAHSNYNMTVVVHNNMLYGMTGGQPSGLTPCGFMTPITPEGTKEKGYDLVNMLKNVGAAHVSRIIGRGDFSEQLAAAIDINGFSLVEVMEICPSYGVKYNPRMTFSEILNQSGLLLETYTRPNYQSFKIQRRDNLPSLLDGVEAITSNYKSKLEKTVSIILSGSAAEGVQLAAELFAKAAVGCGLNVTKKGNYPVTVATGFSNAEIIVSPRPIHYTGIDSPDVVIVTSIDGLAYSRTKIEQMKKGILLIDIALAPPFTQANIEKHDFRNRAGARNSALYSLLYFLSIANIFPYKALIDVISKHEISKKVNLEMLLKQRS